MTSLNIGSLGELSLPEHVRKRYGLTPNTPVRVIETRSGVLIVPLTGEPMSSELARELEQWQDLAAATWDGFGFEEDR